MLDDKFNIYPDLDILMKSFKIDWSKVPGGKAWFMQKLPFVVAEMFAEGEVNEYFYDENNFPVDKDYSGNKWFLKSNSDCLTRSKVSYHPTVVQKKQMLLRTLFGQGKRGI